jgi:hypothetical protein
MLALPLGQGPGLIFYHPLQSSVLSQEKARSHLQFSILVNTNFTYSPSVIFSVVVRSGERGLPTRKMFDGACLTYKSEVCGQHHVQVAESAFALPLPWPWPLKSARKWPVTPQLVVVPWLGLRYTKCGVVLTTEVESQRRKANRRVVSAAKCVRNPAEERAENTTRRRQPQRRWYTLDCTIRYSTPSTHSIDTLPQTAFLAAPVVHRLIPQ